MTQDGSVSILHEFTERYQSALQDYLAGMEEPALQQAYELGRQALQGELGIVDVASVHGEVLERAIQQTRSSKKGAQLAKRAMVFFLEIASAFEMIDRGYREANTTLRQVNAELEKHRDHLEELVAQRTSQLEAANAKLEAEIIERKRAEEALALSNKKLSEVLASIREDFYVLDRDWKFVFANRQFTSRIGKEPEDFIGNCIWDMFPKHVGTIFEENFRATMEKREVRRFEIGGKYTNAWYSMACFPSAEGITVLGTDITKRKRAEEALADSEQRYATTLTSIGDAVIATDPTGAITFMNQVAQDLTGWTMEQALQKPVELIFNVVNEATREPVKSPVRQVIERGVRVGLANHSVLIRRDCTEIAVDDSAAPIQNREGNFTGVVLVFRDITARRQAERALQQMAQFPAENPNPVVRVRPDGTLLYTNKPAQHWLTELGWQAGETLPAPLQVIANQTVQQTHAIETEVDALTGKTFWVSAVQPAGESYINLYSRDITARKRAEEALRESERREHEQATELATLLDAAPTPVFIVHDPEGIHITGNRAADEFLGISRGAEASLSAPTQSKPRHFKAVKDGRELSNDELPAQRAARGTKVQDYEFKLVFDDGSIRDVVGYGTPLYDEHGQPRGAVHILVDITDRKQAEQALRESEAQLRTLLEQLPIGVSMLDRNRKVTYANPALAKITELPSDDLMQGKSTARQYVRADGTPMSFEEFASTRAFQEQHLVHDVETGIVTENGKIIWTNVSAAPSPLEDGGVVIATVDISELKKKEAELNKLNRTLRATSNSNQAMMRITDELEFLDEVCKIIVRDCAYRMVWIGFAEDDEDKTVRPVAHAGFEEGYLETLQVTWADMERGRGPTGTAIRTGEISVCRNMLTDPAFAPWREQALQRGYASSIVFPMRADGKVFGAMTIYSSEPDPFTADEIYLLNELAGDLAFGIGAMRAQVAHAKAETALRESEARYHTLFNNLSEGFALHEIILDDQGKPCDYRFLAINPAFEQLTGFNREDVIGKTYNTVLPGDSPLWIETYGAVALTGEPIHFENYSSVLKRHYEIFAYRPAPLQFAAVFMDITDRKQKQAWLEQAKDELEQRVAERTRELQMLNSRLSALTHQVVNAQEEERQNISRELHDDAGQTLTALKVTLALAKKQLSIEPRIAAQQIGEATTLTNELIDQIRQIAHGLRPPALDVVGLNSALEEQCNDFARRIGIAIDYIGTALPHLSGPVAICFYRVVQEALNNAAKHAHASEIKVKLDQTEDALCLSIEDNGWGFDAEAYHTNQFKPTGMGLMGMRERLKMLGGTLTIDSTVGKGTHLYAQVPKSIAQPPA